VQLLFDLDVTEDRDFAEIPALSDRLMQKSRDVSAHQDRREVAPVGRARPNKRLCKSLPDEKKGERLIVLHKIAEGPLQACLEKICRQRPAPIYGNRGLTSSSLSAFHIWAPANWTCGKCAKSRPSEVPLQRQILRLIPFSSQRRMRLLRARPKRDLPRNPD